MIPPGKPEWWPKARELRLAGKSRTIIARELGVPVRSVRTALEAMYIAAPLTDARWREEADKLFAEGVPTREIAARFNRSVSVVGSYRREWRDAAGAKPARENVHSIEKIERFADRPSMKAKAKRPIAGQVNPTIMEAARAFAQGKISRDEMMARVRG